jgi:hypothetical protein
MSRRGSLAAVAPGMMGAMRFDACLAPGAADEVGATAKPDASSAPAAAAGAVGDHHAPLDPSAPGSLYEGTSPPHRHPQTIFPLFFLFFIVIFFWGLLI